MCAIEHTGAKVPDWNEFFWRMVGIGILLILLSSSRCSAGWSKRLQVDKKRNALVYLTYLASLRDDLRRHLSHSRGSNPQLFCRGR